MSYPGFACSLYFPAEAPLSCPGIAFADVSITQKWYPVVGIDTPCCLDVNFGCRRPFLFDLLAFEQRVWSALVTSPVSRLGTWDWARVRVFMPSLCVSRARVHWPTCWLNWTSAVRPRRGRGRSPRSCSGT